MRTHKGVYYFPTFDAARDYAMSHHWPRDRIIFYTLGWAIQRGISGDYIGPASASEREDREALQSLADLEQSRDAV
jgi:hypothetical protein